ncbi:hypothetical protein R2R35_17105 [Anaerocolumna sp. AGMB13020]|uniref:hypothetical protein n=1 Tax=Anaerocolumna sp. AGMB13020 TaxID=3081750 RepID=UPI002952B9A5|nr:hypothetical protein [Anaerocolumna sp. AGMB13020]WOO35503.1 hypothetical protein R2R35_17105 [Anaerocolumna sp. AGMB13020]
MEYSKKDKILTLKISSGTPLADNYSIESYESNNKDVFIRIRKPLLALRPDKGRSGEDSDSFSITCQIFAELNDNVYFKGTESEEAIYIWSENRVN